MKLRLLSRLYIAPHIKPIDLICKRLEHATVLTYYTTTLSLFHSFSLFDSLSLFLTLFLSFWLSFSLFDSLSLFLTLYLYLSLSLSLSLSLYLSLLLSLTLTHHNSLFLYHSDQTIFEQDLSLSFLLPFSFSSMPKSNIGGHHFVCRVNNMKEKVKKYVYPRSSIRPYVRTNVYVTTSLTAISNIRSPCLHSSLHPSVAIKLRLGL